MSKPCIWIEEHDIGNEGVHVGVAVQDAFDRSGSQWRLRSARRHAHPGVHHDRSVHDCNQRVEVHLRDARVVYAERAQTKEHPFDRSDVGFFPTDVPRQERLSATHDVPVWRPDWAETASDLLWVRRLLTCGRSSKRLPLRLVREFREHPTD